MHIKNWVITLILFTAIFFLIGCNDSNIKPMASFTIEPETIGINEQATFTSTSTDEDGNITNITWMINDQIIGYEKQITYQFNENGTYKVTLKVTDNQQKTGQATKTFYIGGTPSNLKQLFIGSWEWNGKNQTGIWTFYSNNSSITTFTGTTVMKVTEKWQYDITNNTEICFSKPDDPLLMTVCYKFKFHDNFTIIDFTNNGITEQWYKINN